ncbi:phosphate signaling complex protein PhoU [Ignatzschineria cameli]|uniref:Phosphate-specific transport system accessory protein PhoU n=1 Tax=Ignatzschineria cameli TaxID=2182793 RepID=A0A2U2AT40_9GAMM|nr:phosphate signaling complex protein PhoU [Ignatzschineria cameli]PWD87891.1 phosphate transport system regulatory protein PhoU [Ignatzschineria cameli]PWD90459.1 phosphate transport system regulatory protein PhoU [Ignatzschineria cameli]PWD92343.1 phosphate transport system regulatory protein PhoU [Ignatzschineria cameli]PWD93136.1 phosphate transport system regulatory protein PhoU [Ignatzschineria cameli]
MKKLDFTSHISAQFNAELERSMSKVLEMGGLTERQIRDSIKAMTHRDEALARAIIERDEVINELEVEINELCIMIIAKRQPTASDLRLLIVIIKTIAELERIADTARNIAKMANITPAPEHLDAITVSLESLAIRSLNFFEKVLDAFARMDLEMVLTIYPEDDKIDSEYENIIRQLMTYMMEDPRSIPSILKAMNCARSLERIGDRCQNICEFIIYFVKGVDIRVQKNERLQELLDQRDRKAL